MGGRNLLGLVKVLPTDDNSSSDSEFEEELRLAQVPVLGFLIRLTGSHSDSHDLLQQTNLTAWEKRETYELGSNLVSWMCTIAKNHYRNHISHPVRKSTVPLLDDDVALMVEARHEEREKEEARRRKLLHLCIEQLPERHREFVEAFYLDGKSLNDVAAEQGVNANAVAQLLYRARQSLIKCVRKKSHAELDSDNP